MSERRLGRNPAQDTSLGGCRPLGSYRTVRAAQAVGADVRYCACGFYHRDYSRRLPAEDCGQDGVCRLSIVSSERRARTAFTAYELALSELGPLSFSDVR